MTTNQQKKVLKTEKKIWVKPEMNKIYLETRESFFNKARLLDPLS
ncbi:hypothetical protein EMA8858_03831 [Emticicia aquatica]|uniref:Uncharacterized protein n=1 Tax=Emticicia aquatica TaxID=1681835 RepID=A0ABM9AUU1_9BACT|nr:hypothetical protein EMA8858_03831 [Emticicia aquatica]